MSPSKLLHKAPAAGLLLAAFCLSACVQNTAARPANSSDTQPEAAPAAAAGAAAGTAVPAAAMLKAHNQWRAKVGSPALQWSEKLTRMAQEWADKLAASGCSQHHRGNMQYGENIYFASPLLWPNGRTEAQPVTPQYVADDWGKEEKNYDHASNSCSGICGHYTQLVWKDSKEVGCGMAFCANKAQVWVCNYHPVGNVMGERPY